MSGAKYKLVDQQEQIFLLAWAIRQAKSRKKAVDIFIAHLINSLIVKKSKISWITKKILPLLFQEFKKQ